MVVCESSVGGSSTTQSVTQVQPAHANSATLMQSFACGITVRIAQQSSMLPLSHLLASNPPRPEALSQPIADAG